MKSLFVIASLALMSSSAFARLCNVEMVDNRTNRVIDTFLDRDDDCSEAMVECKTQIRLRGLTRGKADCHLRELRRDRRDDRRNDRRDDRYDPRPNENSARRPVVMGETVIVYNRRMRVEANSGYWIYLRDQYGFSSQSRREEIAVTSGCEADLCVGERVINTLSNKELTIVGLEFDGEYVGEDSYNFMTPNMNRMNIAKTTGCMGYGRDAICVGAQVIDRLNNYSTVIGLMMNGNLVIKSRYNFITSNVNPREVVITR